MGGKKNIYIYIGESMPMNALFNEGTVYNSNFVKNKCSIGDVPYKYIEEYMRFRTGVRQTISGIGAH